MVGGWGRDLEKRYTVQRNEEMNAEVQAESTYNNKRKPAEIQ